PKRNILVAGTGLRSTLDEGTRKSQLLPEGNKSDPKDLVGNIQPIDTGLPFTVSNKGAAKTTSLPKGPRGDKDSEGLKPPIDMEPQINHVADPSGTDAYDDEDVLEAGEDIDVFLHQPEYQHQSPPNTDKPEPFPTQETQESDFDSSSLELKKYDNILPLIERQLVKYLRKVSRVLVNRLIEDQWEKHE
ncbi:hypothetical protein Tco_0108503, partial [Tanacetum coccineum]